ncbi:GNAT family N-acetyltransferase [Ensifer sp. SL37]|uniref:GNAT family N-acetyltransferase n=1 Tax=Ensifer sp. SL37 TaxID=2995137 RepID=UPI002272A4E4|nr:GNAT family N-acetyltransferase [Ensifer sp. SL37]MCY1745071.1 GNAT family N-acetyltransferase [Ensifer sp. SL37]
MKEEVQSHVAEVLTIAVDRIKLADHADIRSLRVGKGQESFVASNEDSLEEAEDNPACVPLIIRAQGNPVGFAMYALDEDDGNYWIYRLMIDSRFQGKGYGRAALLQIINKLSGIPDCSCIMLGVKPGNDQAIRIYERVGFRLTGDTLDGEFVMKYEI